MKVLQIGPYPPPHGGVQTNLVAIRNYLRRHGIAAPVINVTRHRRPAADDVHYPQSAQDVWWLLWRLDYDIVHLHIGGTLTARLLALGLLCTTIPGKRAVLTFHSGGYPSSPAGRASTRWTFAGLVLRRFDAVIAVNEEILTFFLRLGVPRERVNLILPNAPARVPPGTTLPNDLAAFVQTHRPVLLTVGLLESEYDLGLQIEVLGRLRERIPDAGLVIIGSGSLADDLRHRMGTVPWASHILIAGDQPHAVTLRAIAAADLCLRTTWYDGDAISVREALELGTPVIATDTGLRPAGVDLIPVSDPAALQNAIERQVAAGCQRRPQVPGGEGNLKAVLDLYCRHLRGTPSWFC